MTKIGRNDRCPCGSGKKYKHCCQSKELTQTTSTRANKAFIPIALQMAVELHQSGQIPQAKALYQQVLQADTNQPDALHMLGVIEHQQGNSATAVKLIQQAAIAMPEAVMCHFNLGNTYQDLGQLNEAVASYRQALAIQPGYEIAHNNLLFVLQSSSTCPPAEIFAEHQRYAERFETPLKSFWQPHPNSRGPERRLKVGYVSGDFRQHAVAYFIEPILASHDKARFEIFGYSNNAEHDSYTERIASHMDHWLVCWGLSDTQLAERIRADGIDILVDLSGHTAHNRMLVFARKPAPLQVTWIGYQGSTGLTAMDYRITDAWMDPPGQTERYHSEALVRLPDGGFAYQPEPDCAAVNALPALTSGELVFASLNTLSKINPTVVKFWARILNALPRARLMLGNVTNGEIGQRLTGQFSQAGIGPERLILKPKMSTADYLALHQQIDIGLDPFPYNGGTTTMHSLWMGVPVITLAGNHAVSRFGVSLMSRVGLPEFIAHSEEEYVQCALRLAQDLPGLDRIRQSLRQRMSGAAWDPAVITRHLEAAYRTTWRTWCGQSARQ